MPKVITETSRSVRYLVNFTREELELVKQATVKDQAAIRTVLGKKYPNKSNFIAQAAVEKAERILNKK